MTDTAVLLAKALLVAERNKREIEGIAEEYMREIEGTDDTRQIMSLLMWQVALRSAQSVEAAFGSAFSVTQEDWEGQTMGTGTFTREGVLLRAQIVAGVSAPDDARDLT